MKTIKIFNSTAKSSFIKDISEKDDVENSTPKDSPSKDETKKSGSKEDSTKEQEEKNVSYGDNEVEKALKVLLDKGFKVTLSK
jgi:hypothetical protein